MPTYKCWNAMDPNLKLLGEFVVDDKGVIEKWVPSNGRPGYFAAEVGTDFDVLRSRLRNYIFRDTKGGEDVEKGDKHYTDGVYTLRTVQSGDPVCDVVVRNGRLAEYHNENPPVGYEQGREFKGFIEDPQIGYDAEQKVDFEEMERQEAERARDEAQRLREDRILEAADKITATTVHTPSSDAATVGTAVGAALTATGLISKVDKAKQNVFGWAYVVMDKDGEVVIDKSGDFIDDVEEIEKAAYDYVLRSRQSDADHTNVKSGEMIESIVFTPEKIEKMGIPAGVVPLGWWVGYHIDDKKTWERVEKGELRSFSIHGRGTRQKVEP